MADIVCQDIHKYYGDNHILQGISFEIYEGERVGLLGKNGAGKTTLFNILDGTEPFEEGNVFIPKNKQMEVLDQIPMFPSDYSVKDVLKTGFEELLAMLKSIKELEEKMSSDQDPLLLKRYGEIAAVFEVKGGYMMETDLAIVCEGLQIDSRMLDKPFSKLSGGEQTRVNLGRIILKKPDILLLDEPTNHLDVEACEWLEEYLNTFKGTVVVISHDRYFLDRVVTRIIEIELGKAVFYEGNYSDYVKLREERYQQLLASYEQEQKKIQQLEAAAKRMHDWASRADNKSMHRRAFALEKRIERIERTEKPFLEKNMKAKFKEIEFSGKDFIIIRDINKSFGQRKILEDINLTVRKGDRIGLIGPNGCGKTTLLNIIANIIQPDNGDVRIGRSVEYAFLPQIIEFENPELSMLETVRYAMEWSEDTARNRLAAFQFTGEEVFKQVSSLSGGEKSRLKLFLLMQEEINLLILDEPTNHLDIASREWIERTLESFGGTLLFVSHDRYFIKQFATRIWDLKDGKVIDYKGTYQDYRRWRKMQDSIKPDEKNQEKRPKQVRKKRVNPKDIEKKLRMLERDIMAYELMIEDIENKMEHAASDFEKLQELMEEKEELIEKMDSLYDNWAELSETL
ncbi:MAG: ABC-F type ribosomal protection protein [Clostridiaceae bacterium]|jgi:ATPase subunit of ABC transporter with duplicated ATPase domains|nr:ABC-F type ribosomal protection protein [Clostridiaceae bacterium]